MNTKKLPLEQFYYFEKILKHQVYLRQPIEGRWIELTWGEVGLQARTLAQTIIDLNLPPKTCIALLSKNCAHWIITDLAIWMAGHISVPLYPTSNAQTIQYVLEHSEAPLLFAGKLDEWHKQKSAVPKNVKVISFPFWQNEGTVLWAEFIKDKKPLIQDKMASPHDVATIIYTSGTTGQPKGVVHSFQTMSSNMDEALKLINLTSNERFISYLPLSHVAERLLIEMGSLYTGGSVSFAESIESFAKNLMEIRPTVFLAVPRIWLKFQQGILGKISQRKLNILLSIPIVNRMIKNKIKSALGLDQVHFAITGAAAVAPELLSWFSKLDLTPHEVYGMTENFGITSFNSPGKVRFGTVGAIFPKTQCKISHEGEILTRSTSNMIGYFKEEEKTKEMIDNDGWIHTGDLGELSQDGFLKVTGRMKDLFKTSKGKYIAPSVLENHFLKHGYIEQVCVVGDGLPQPLALVVLSEQGRQLEQDDVFKIFKQELIVLNEKVHNFERVSTIVIVGDDWSTESGILTPTLKIKRNVVEKKYQEKIKVWSEDSLKIIFFEPK